MGLFPSKKAARSTAIGHVKQEIVVSENAIGRLNRRKAASQQLEELGREKRALLVRAYANDDPSALAEIQKIAAKSREIEVELSNVQGALEEETARLAGLRVELSDLEDAADIEADRARFHQGCRSNVATAESLEAAVQALFTVLDKVQDGGKHSDEVLAKLGLRNADSFKFQYDHLAAAFGYFLRDFRHRYGVNAIDYSGHARSFAEYMQSQCDIFTRELEKRDASRQEASEAINDKPDGEDGLELAAEAHAV
jgi:hypothetical protein